MFQSSSPSGQQVQSEKASKVLAKGKTLAEKAGLLKIQLILPIFTSLEGQMNILFYLLTFAVSGFSQNFGSTLTAAPLVISAGPATLHGIHVLNRDGQANRGPGVLLVHGLMSNFYEFQALAQELMAKGYDCYAFNWRGHGNGLERSTLSHYRDGDYGVRMMAEEDFPAMLAHVAEKTGGPVQVFGHSMGGMVPRWSLQLGKVPATQLRSLILFGSPAQFKKGQSLPWLAGMPSIFKLWIEWSTGTVLLRQMIWSGSGAELINPLDPLGLRPSFQSFVALADATNLYNGFYWAGKAMIASMWDFSLRAVVMKQNLDHLGEELKEAFTSGIPKDVLRSFDQDLDPFAGLQIPVPSLHVMAEEDGLAPWQEIAGSARRQGHRAGQWQLLAKNVSHVDMVATTTLRRMMPTILEFMKDPHSLGPANQTRMVVGEDGSICRDLLAR